MNLLEINLEKLRSVLGSDFEHGLSEDQVLRNRSEFGENILFEKQNTLAGLLRKIFGDVMMVILILVSLFAFLDSGAAAPFLTALLVVVSYSLYVFFTYRYCARAKAKVNKYCKNKYHVRRDGVIASVEKSELVPGDILLLEKGDVMPCDGIILRRKELRILEASVTGRRLPVIKRSYDEVYSEEGYPYFECVLFAGSVVLQGSAKVFVCNTGKNIFDHENFTVSRQNTQVPDIYRIALELKKQISLIWILACFLLFAWGIFRGQGVFDMFYFACAVVIAAFPDSIEHLSDLSIAFMTSKLFDAGCILRNPASIDRLCDVNSVFVNSSDYLYYSHPVAGAYFIGGRHYSFEDEPKRAAPLLENILLSQSSQAYYRALPNREEYYVERALLAAAAKIGIQKKALEKNNMYIARYDFDAKRGFSASLVMNEGGYRLIVRGRVNDILPLCSFEMKGEQKIALNESGRALLRSHSRSLAGRCEKTCAVAIRDLSSPSSGDQRSNCRDMTFLGIFGLYTPVSGESARAVDTCRRAGIHTYLLTDDYPETVAALSKSVSIIRDGDHQSALDYRSYQRLDRGVFIADLEKYKAFCGFPAEEKQSIIQYHKEEGNITLSLTSGLSDTLPQMESDLSFVSLTEPTKAVIQNADFLLREKKYQVIPLCINWARTFTRNIIHAMKYVLHLQIALFLIAFIGLATNGTTVFSVFPLMALGMLVCIPAGVNLIHRKPGPKLEERIGSLKERAVSWHTLLFSPVIAGVVSALCTSISYQIAFFVSQNFDAASNAALITFGLSAFFTSLAIKFDDSIFKNLHEIGRTDGYAFLSALLSLIFLIFTPIARLFNPSFSQIGSGLGFFSVFFALLLSVIPMAVIELTKFLHRQEESEEKEIRARHSKKADSDELEETEDEAEEDDDFRPETATKPILEEKEEEIKEADKQTDTSLGEAQQDDSAEKGDS